MSITSDFSKFKKIDAHSHIGTFGSPFNIHFNADLLLKQMEEFNIEKTILCSDGPHTNEETVAAFKAHPDKIIPLMWINCAEGKPAYARPFFRSNTPLGCSLLRKRECHDFQASCIPSSFNSLTAAGGSTLGARGSSSQVLALWVGLTVK